MIDFKQDKALWLAFALPVAMIVFIAASIYLPRLWAPAPQYSFVYTGDSLVSVPAPGGGPVCTFRVSDGHLVVGGNPSQERECFDSVYVYDPVSNESHAISLNEAQNLKLDDRKKSPDGFEVKRSFSSGGLFGGSSGGGVYFSGHMTSHKLDLRGIERAYDFQFVGWVTP